MAKFAEAAENVLIDDELGNVNIDIKPLVVTTLSPKAVRNLLIEENPNATDIAAKYRLPKAIIELRVIDQVDTWHGKKGIYNFDRHKIIEAFVDKGVYLTGLTDDERKYLEAITGYTLHNHYNPYSEHPFYEKMIGRMKLENKTMLLNLEEPMSYIKYKMLLNHPLVANSLSDFENGLNPQATHYIVDNEEEELKELQKASKYKEADSLWNNLNTPGLKRSALSVLMNSDCSFMSPDTVEARLLNIKNQEVSNFNEVAKQPKDILTNKALLISAISKIIVIHKDGMYTYNDTLLGNDLDAAATFLSNPQNQQLRIRILDHLKSKLA